MTGSRVVLHIGIGKTGSSSLQAWLSRHGETVLAAHGYRYCAVDAKGDVSSGATLHRAACASVLGYQSSQLPFARPEAMTRVREQLTTVLAEGAVPILSQEDWHRRAREFAASRLLEQLGCAIDVVAYVRPQIDWFNAAWWQWFAWEKEFRRPEDVIAKWGLNALRWGAQLTRWRSLPGVRSVTVRLQAANVIEDFAAVIGIPREEPLPPGARVNQAMGFDLAKLYMACPELRGMHGAETDVVLAPFVDGGERAPWAIPGELVARLMPMLQSENALLLQMLAEDQREAMRADARWWSAEAYPREAADATGLGSRFTREDSLALVAALVPAQVELQRRLKSQQRSEETIRNLSIERGVLLAQVADLHGQREEAARWREHAEALERSLSWRLTRPLRRVREWFESLRGHSATAPRSGPIP